MKISSNTKDDNDKEKQWFQILAVVIAGIAALTNGIFFSWPSPFILKISQDKENYNISEEEASKFAVLPFLAIVMSCPTFSRLSDVFGRKRILLSMPFVEILIWTLKATGKSVYVFYLARFIVGVAHGIMFAALPAYLGEVAAPNIRGTWGNSMTIFFRLGQLLITIVGCKFSVQATSLIFIPIPILFFVLFSFMPESPYFYVMRGRYDEAKESLRVLKRKEDVTSEFLALKADVQRQMSEEGTWREMLKIDSNQRSLAAGVLLRVSSILAGTHVFSIFTQYIFDKSQGALSSEASSIIFISISLLLSLFACLVVDRLGRKKTFISSLIPCSAVLFIEAIYFFVYDKRPDINISSFNWVPIAGMVLYIIFNSYGIGIMPTLMLGELFSTSFRATAMSVLMILDGSASVIANSLFYALSSGIGLHAPFLFFACCNMLSAVLSFYILPETKGKTLEEIQQSMKKTSATRENENLIQPGSRMLSRSG
ncbi:hypothetical protein JTB14_037338 [Gonioctena quinquepunctata]|nr:hypothetical protein JTB14_037338 [Gonioctena quinquepunctata]